MKTIFKSILLGAIAIPFMSNAAWAAKDPVITDIQPYGGNCGLTFNLSATPTRNVSGGFDLLQYRFVGTYADGREIALTDDWWYGNFSWTWVRTGRVWKRWYYGIGSNPRPEKFELVFYDGASQHVLGNEFLERIDLSEYCSANSAPIADAGEDVTGALPNQLINLDGTASSDEDGDDLTYNWRQTSGPAVDLFDANTAAPSFLYPPGRADQVIEFELTVYDGKASSEPDSVQIIHNGRSNGNGNGRN